MKAAEDFFLHVVYAHIIVVGRATNVFNTASTAAELAKLIVANHILLPSNEGGKKASPCADKVYLYRGLQVGCQVANAKYSCDRPIR